MNAISIDKLATTELSENDLCISLLEIEEPFLATLNQEDLDIFHGLTNTIRDLVWLTGVNLLAVPNPDLTLVHGLFRALRVEQP